MIKSYLTNRKVYTFINNTSSDTNHIKFGVPQGSVLGPILFSLYINDIKFLAEKYHLNLFADDTCLFCTANTYDELNIVCNQALVDCHNWLHANRLTLNKQKTHYVNFSSNHAGNQVLVLKLGEHTIEEKDHTKYLGMILQGNLKWENHIKTLINKLNRQIPLIYQLKEILPKSKLLIVYKSIALSHIMYGIELYVRETKWTKQIQKVQNRILKIILSKDALTRTNHVHLVGKVLKVQDYMKMRSLLICHKVVYQKEQTNISHKNMKLNLYNGRNMRNNLNFELQVNAYSKMSKVTERSMVLWNELPQSLKTIKSRNNFKSKLEEHFLNTYK